MYPILIVVDFNLESLLYMRLTAIIIIKSNCCCAKKFYCEARLARSNSMCDNDIVLNLGEDSGVPLSAEAKIKYKKGFAGI